MIRNYFKIALRNLLKHKLLTGINLFGLIIGTVSYLIILIYVLNQTGYDQHFDHAENIYRIETVNGRGDKPSFNTATTSPPIAPALKSDFPEVSEMTRIVLTDLFNVNLIRASLEVDGYYEPRAYLADSTVFKIFQFHFIEGSPIGALNAPNQTVLSATLAEKLFGNTSVVGKTVIWGSGAEAQTLTITGVFDDESTKSHLNPNYFVSMTTPGMGEFVSTFQNFATNNFVYSYIKLIPDADAQNVQEKLPSFIQKHGKKQLENAGMVDKKLFLKKITDIHLYSEGRDNQIGNVSNIKYLYFLLALAFFIQLVACINFINLSTARANQRAKEIGVRKVVGAGKGSLIRQFLSESLLLSLIAMLISIPIAILLLPLVNELTLGSLSYLNIFNWKVLILLLSISILTGLLAGIYPAIILSSIKPIQVLKSAVQIQSGNGMFRKALVVFQFVISISLIVSVIIITQQFKYTQSKDLGFNKENMVALRAGTSDVTTKYDAIKSSFLNIPGVVSVSSGRYAPFETVLNDNGMFLPGKNPQDLTIVRRNGVSKDYFNTMNIDLLQGRDFNATDDNQIIVNKATLKSFNIPEDKALSTILLQTHDEVVYEYPIVGVVDDYHFTTLKDEIVPLFLHLDNEPNWVFVKFKTDDYKQLVSNLESTWKKNIDAVPFTYVFVDKEVENLYAQEQRLSKICTVFTFLAILISCLGLFGLVSYYAEQKKKEIGIRKVLGASVQTVVKLLTKDFVVLVIIAFVIATPLAYLAMHNWLENFTYRIDISVWVFILAGIGALLIALITVSFQAIKAAIANPINSLRTE
ncbi:ABC transporter permease [Formosa sp. PL04]|uniref:ABC transporter permease n=1 Tax=Formosa sp. PL04 TaxID=3081755 RepID=UPI002981893E|nr:ABC transporter permease [Formosa sp. PL04]MDW5290177.1 ABC transporter permease [Formosa sp. PL04]